MSAERGDAAELELELKLALPPQQAERLKRHPALRPISPHRAVVSDLDAVYFDTPDLRLQAKGVAVRLREAGGRWVQTVKTRGDTRGALHRRLEWEVPSDGTTLDFAGIDDARLRKWLESEEIRTRLQPVFRTRFRRWARLLLLADGTRIELALDQGRIEAGQREAPISEVELELKSGRAVALFELALALQPGLDLLPEPRSKAERGYGLHAGQIGQPMRARAPVADPRWTPAEACAAFLAAGQEQLERNLAGAILATEPEFLHQTRVALRRIRATLAVFRRLLPAELALNLGSELRWLMAEVGPARDWDVFVAETLPRVRAAFPAEDALTGLAALAETLRTAAQIRARTALQSPRAITALLRIGHLGTALGAGEMVPANGAGDLRSFARQTLRKRARRADVSREALAALDTAGRHAWRIALKKLRYSADFLTPVFDRPGVARRWLDTLAALQDLLGTMNDADTTHALLEQLSASAVGVDARALALVRGFAAGHSAAHLETLEQARARLEACPLPWKA